MTTKTEIQRTSEADHQKVVIEWARLHEKKYPCLKFLYACPNEGKHKVQYRVHQKAMGVKSGVPDLFLPYPVLHGVVVNGPHPRWCMRKIFNYCGLYIEMKTIGGKISDNQKEFIDYLKEQGYKVEVCWNADTAIEVIEDYLR